SQFVTLLPPIQQITGTDASEVLFAESGPLPCCIGPSVPPASWHDLSFRLLTALRKSRHSASGRVPPSNATWSSVSPLMNSVCPGSVRGLNRNGSTPEPAYPPMIRSPLIDHVGPTHAQCPGHLQFR